MSTRFINIPDGHAKEISEGRECSSGFACASQPEGARMCLVPLVRAVDAFGKDGNRIEKTNLL